MNKFKLMLALLAAPSMVLASCQNETPEVEGSISKVSVIAESSVMVGQTITATANVSASGGASKEVTWSSSDETVATVDSNGVITGLKVGTATITATSKFDSTKSGSAQVSVTAKDWSDDIKADMEENLGMVLPYFDGDFEWSVDEDGYLLAESSNEADIEKVIAAYDALEIDKEVEEDYVEYTFPTDNEDLVVAVDVYEDEGKAYVEPYLAFKILTEWPAEKVAAALEGYTELTPEEVPAAVGTEYGFQLDEEYEYSCYVLVFGSYVNYGNKLIDLGWGIDTSYYSQYGVIRFSSPLSSIVIDMYVRSAEAYQLNIYATGDPLQPVAEWPAEAVAEMMNGHSEVAIPEAEGTGFLYGVAESEEDFYYGYVEVFGGEYSNYLVVLEGAGFSVAYDAKYECYTAIKEDLALDIYLSGPNFYIQPYEYVAPVVEWPAEQVATFIGEHTEETVPAAEGTAFSTSERTSPYNALVIDVTGDVSAYLLVLEGAEWQINDLTASYGYYDCYSPEHYLELAIFPDEGEFEIQLLLSEPPAPEFPAEALAEFIGDHTTDTVPSPTGTGFENGISKGVFWANITGGDASDYMETLELAGYVSHDKLDLGSSVHVFTSESGALQLVLIESTGSFELDVYKVAAPQYDEYPADLVNAFTGAVTEEVLVAPEADGFDVVGEQEDFYGDTYYELVARYGDAY